MLRTLIVLVISTFLSTTSIAQEEIAWMTMNDALEAQKSNPKKILMDVYTDWCGPCKLMDKNTFQNRDVVKFINQNFYAVKFNAEGAEPITYDGFTYTNPNHQPERKGRNATHFFADALRISGYPSLVFFEKDGALIQPITGYKSPQELEIYLRMIANDDYKKLTTMEAWEAYQKNFKGSFADSKQ